MANVKQLLTPLANTDPRVQPVRFWQGNLRRQFFVVEQFAGIGTWSLFAGPGPLRRAVKAVQNVGNLNIGAIICVVSNQFFLWTGPVP